MKTILVDALGAFVINGEGVYKPLFDLLETYPNKKIILTMATPEKMKEFGMEKLPYEVYTSCFDPKKVDPNYYKEMLQKYNLETGNVLYFEHDVEAVKSATSVGIKTHFYNNLEQDIEKLKDFIDSNL